MGTFINHVNWFQSRENGSKFRAKRSDVTRDSIATNLYSNMSCFAKWEGSNTSNHTHHGGIFNFDFSKDGSVLVAACEKKSLLLFDPLTAKLNAAKENAHSDSINCIRFLDSRLFCSCSDDKTIALWDLRYMKYRVSQFVGHTNWVKNIEYSQSEALLVTSGFDGAVNVWNVNSGSAGEHKQVFQSNGLMRTKLSPDSSKLIIAMCGGYLMVVHNLNLNTLAYDLKDFQPNLYRLMQISGEPTLPHANFSPQFTAKRNRLELISDFPKDNDAELISSIDIHPQNWCVVSRNTSSDERTEWTCVHDIQTPVQSDREIKRPASSSLSNPDAFIKNSIQATSLAFWDLMENGGRGDSREPMSFSITLNPTSPSNDGGVAVRINTGTTDNADDSATWGRLGGSAHDTDDDEEDLDENHDIESQSQETRHSADSESHNTQDLHDVTDSETDDAAVQEDLQSASFRSYANRDNPCLIARRQRRNSGSRNSTSSSQYQPPPFSITLGSIVSGGVHRTVQVANSRASSSSANEGTVHPAYHRLTHYIEEPNQHKGFIKELTFSSDGRLVLSPFAFGARLLAFHPNCLELCDCPYATPTKFTEISSSSAHSNTVVCAKFSPTLPLYVTGCLNSTVAFHQPRFG